MNSLMALNPDEARAILQEMIASSRKVQATFVSLRSGTHVFVRGMVQQTPDGVGFAVADNAGAIITVDPTQASTCKRADAHAASLDAFAQRFSPALEFTGGLILEFNRTEKLVVFAISSDKSN